LRMGSPLTQAKIAVFERQQKQQQRQGVTASMRLNLQTEVQTIDFTVAISESTIIVPSLFQPRFFMDQLAQNYGKRLLGGVFASALLSLPAALYSQTAATFDIDRYSPLGEVFFETFYVDETLTLQEALETKLLTPQLSYWLSKKWPVI